MALSRRKLRFRFRFRFGFGLLAGLAVLLMLAPAAFAGPAKPKPKPKPKHTPAGDQYKPAGRSNVTATAIRIGKCKVAVVRIYTPKKKACKGKKACLTRLNKAELAAKKKCDRLAQPAAAVTVKTPVKKA